MAKLLSIDIETYSDIDLLTCGVYRYVDTHNFEILLLADSVAKTAFNVNFERTCINQYFALH